MTKTLTLTLTLTLALTLALALALILTWISLCTVESLESVLALASANCTISCPRCSDPMMTQRSHTGVSQVVQ